MASGAIGPSGAVLAMNLTALVAFLAGGFSLMFGQRKMAGRLVLLALFLGVASGLAPHAG